MATSLHRRGGGEDDLGVLIIYYRESQLRKAEAATARMHLLQLIIEPQLGRDRLLTNLGEKNRFANSTTQMCFKKETNEDFDRKKVGPRKLVTKKKITEWMRKQSSARRSVY